MRWTVILPALLMFGLACANENSQAFFERVAEIGVKSVPKEHYDNYILYWVLPNETTEQDVIDFAGVIQVEVTPNTYIAIGGPSADAKIEFIITVMAVLGIEEYQNPHLIIVGEFDEFKQIESVMEKSKIEWSFQSL